MSNVTSTEAPAGPPGLAAADVRPAASRTPSARSTRSAALAHIALFVWALATAGPLIWVRAGLVQDQHRDLPGPAVRAAGVVLASRRTWRRGTRRTSAGTS